MTPFTPYIAGAALTAFLALGGGLYVQTQRLDASKAENAALRLQIGACEADAANVREDKETDNEVDNIPDTDLRNAPVDWMLPPGSGGVY